MAESGFAWITSLTKLDELPLPRIDDTLDLLTGQKYFIYHEKTCL